MKLELSKKDKEEIRMIARGEIMKILYNAFDTIKKIHDKDEEEAIRKYIE